MCPQNLGSRNQYAAGPDLSGEVPQTGEEQEGLEPGSQSFLHELRLRDYFTGILRTK